MLVCTGKRAGSAQSSYNEMERRREPFPFLLSPVCNKAVLGCWAQPEKAESGYCHILGRSIAVLR